MLYSSSHLLESMLPRSVSIRSQWSQTNSFVFVKRSATPTMLSSLIWRMHNNQFAGQYLPIQLSWIQRQRWEYFEIETSHILYEKCSCFRKYLQVINQLLINFNRIFSRWSPWRRTERYRSSTSRWSQKWRFELGNHLDKKNYQNDKKIHIY